MIRAAGFILCDSTDLLSVSDSEVAFGRENRDNGKTRRDLETYDGHQSKYQLPGILDITGITRLKNRSITF
jgi:hypothetical protein